MENSDGLLPVEKQQITHELISAIGDTQSAELSLSTQPEEVVSTSLSQFEEVQRRVEEQGVNSAPLRDKAGKLFKVYFGTSADVILLNELNRSMHPLT